jgi:tRNA(Ile)-lysidine synthase
VNERLARALVPWRARLLELDDVQHVIVACSGGADSLALLALASVADVSVVAVYVDHGLRPTTQHDIAVVAEAARLLGVPLETVAVDVATGGNLEARARDARYSALERVRDAHDADAILVGHTRDDQAETVLLNTLRGSATSGLAGMPSRRGMIRRPLLALRRADTHEICARLGFAPVHDPMNDDIRHRRVWLRRELMPRLEQGARRDLVDVLARQAEVARDDDALLAALAADAMGVAPAGAGAGLDARRLITLPNALARRVVRGWLAVPSSFDQIEAILAVARGERRAVELEGGRRVERVQMQLHIVVLQDAAPVPSALLIPGRCAFGCWEVEAWIEEGPPAGWPDGAEAVVADAARVGERAAIRAARPGDRFTPLGRRGAKTVFSALAEVGVPSALRHQQPVVVDAADEVIWVVGYRIDERVRVTTQTSRFLWIEASSDPERATA